MSQLFQIERDRLVVLYIGCVLGEVHTGRHRGEEERRRFPRALRDPRGGGQGDGEGLQAGATRRQSSDARAALQAVQATAEVRAHLANPQAKTIPSIVFVYNWRYIIF